MTKATFIVNTFFVVFELNHRQHTIQIYSRFYNKWNIAGLFLNVNLEQKRISINAHIVLEKSFKTLCLHYQTPRCGYSLLHSTYVNLGH